MQEPHDEPAPAITPLLPIAENNEIIRPVRSLPHLGHAMGASASDIARRASKHISQSAHLYSYSGINSPLFYTLGFVGLFYRHLAPSSRPGVDQNPISCSKATLSVPCLAHLDKGIHHTINVFVGVGCHVAGPQQRRLGGHRR